MSNIETAKRILAKRKFPVVQETEKCLVFRYQMNYVQISALKDDDPGFSVTLAGVFTADNENEMRLGLKTCNELNYRMMLAKFYIDEDNDLIIASEFFYVNEDDAEQLLFIALNAVISGKKRFMNQYESIAEDDKLLREMASE